MKERESCGRRRRSTEMAEMKPQWMARELPRHILRRMVVVGGRKSEQTTVNYSPNFMAPPWAA
jgi:hypothetical protein